MHADPVQAVVEAMSRRPALDEDAFDVAVGAFHRAYTHAFRPVLASEAQEAHDEAVREALEVFLATYTELVGR